MLVEVVWKGNHLTEDGEYYPYGVTFVDISLADWTKLKNLLGSLSFPLDTLFHLFNYLRVIFGIRKLRNPLKEPKEDQITSAFGSKFFLQSLAQVVDLKVGSLSRETNAETDCG
jgi:hypothetical protein